MAENARTTTQTDHSHRAIIKWMVSALLSLLFLLRVRWTLSDIFEKSFIHVLQPELSWTEHGRNANSKWSDNCIKGDRVVRSILNTRFPCYLSSTLILPLAQHFFDQLHANRMSFTFCLSTINLHCRFPLLVVIHSVSVTRNWSHFQWKTATAKYVKLIAINARTQRLWRLRVHIMQAAQHFIWLIYSVCHLIILACISYTNAHARTHAHTHTDISPLFFFRRNLLNCIVVFTPYG